MNATQRRQEVEKSVSSLEIESLLSEVQLRKKKCQRWYYGNTQTYALNVVGL